MTKLLSFDLDGTLADSKQPLPAVISNLLEELSHKYLIAIISGGDYSQFENCVIQKLNSGTDLSVLYLLPTSGGKIYQYLENSWQQVFTAALSDVQKSHILKVIAETKVLNMYKSDRIYGEIVEDRQTQFTLSMLGQKAPFEVKQSWDPDRSKRAKIREILAPLLPEYDVRFGGSTSIEIAQKGINKAFGMRKVLKLTNLRLVDVVFFGDSLTPGGNDYPIKELGVECVAVESWQQTAKHLKLLANH